MLLKARLNFLSPAPLFEYGTLELEAPVLGLGKGEIDVCFVFFIFIFFSFKESISFTSTSTTFQSSNNVCLWTILTCCVLQRERPKAEA